MPGLPGRHFSKHERRLLDEKIKVVFDIARVDRMPRRECDHATRRVERRASADLHHGATQQLSSQNSPSPMP